jgi:hypothetical protein
VSAPFQVGPVQGLNAALCGGAAALSFALGSERFAASVAVGGLIEALNFRTLRRVAVAIAGGAAPGGAAAVGSFGLRFALVGLAVGVALRQGAHPVGLVLGLSMIVPAALAGAWMRRPLPAAAEALPAPPPDDASWDDWDPWLARARDPEARDAEDDEA